MIAPRPRPALESPPTVRRRSRTIFDVLYQSGHRRGLRVPIYLLRVLVQVIRQWARDRCPQQAASLAFQTALSLVPVVTVALSLLRVMGEFEAQSTLVEFIAREVLPSVSRQEIAAHLVSFASKTSVATAGIAGIASTLLLAYVMYASVEKIFNDVWKIDRRRSLGQKFVVFYAVVTLVPALVGVSLYRAARYGLTTGFSGELFAIAATWTGLFVANKLLPATRVSWRAAAFGALISALAFEGAKNLFQLYVARVAFKSYAGVYGALGLVPLLLLWIYYSWLVVLFGAEAGHTVQNLHFLEGEGSGRRRQDVAAGQVNGTVAARLLCAVVQTWRATGKATKLAELSRRFDLSDGVAEQILSRLRGGGLVLEVDGDTSGYLPARPPTEISLLEVLELFRGGDAAQRGPAQPPTRLDEVLDEIDRAVRTKGRAVNLDELARG